MTLAFRVIARLDVKGGNLIKGIQFEGLRVLGKPSDFARRYAEQGADELLYLDTVASLYGRGNLTAIIEQAADGVFIPITAGGGVRSEADVKALLRAGADKVAINTAALADPGLIDRCAALVGSQAIVCSVEAKATATGWEAYTDQGRSRTGRCAVEWALEAAGRGAGEILLTAIDRDGTRRGGDLGLAQAIRGRVGCPVVLAGGIGTPAQALEAAGVADAVALGSALHYGRTDIRAVKAALAGAGRVVRQCTTEGA